MHGSMGGGRKPAPVGKAARSPAPLAYPTNLFRDGGLVLVPTYSVAISVPSRRTPGSDAAQGRPARVRSDNRPITVVSAAYRRCRPGEDTRTDASRLFLLGTHARMRGSGGCRLHRL